MSENEKLRCWQSSELTNAVPIQADNLGARRVSYKYNLIMVWIVGIGRSLLSRFEFHISTNMCIEIRATSLTEDRDGRKLSIDETKEIVLKVLNGPEGFRVLKNIASKMDKHVDNDAGDGADRRLSHHLTVHFPDCVLSGEAECKEAILADLESSPDTGDGHCGGSTEEALRYSNIKMCRIMRRNPYGQTACNEP